MSIEKNKRVLNKKFQKAYYDKYPYDQLELAINGYVVQRDEVHEIVHGSRKTYEDWNMISLSAENHRLAHQNRITKRELFLAKLKSGFKLPDHIMLEFDLLEGE